MANEQAAKMTGASLEIAAEQRARLKELFPSVFAETVGEDGQLVESVDFAKLQAELGTFTDVFENRRERYGMDWPGKKDALRLIQSPSHATLKPCRAESVNFDTTEHLFIEGDNLEVLKLLQKSYYGKVKMIYIDPPYNTGKEFIYPDNYTEDLQTYLEYAGLADSSGKKFSTNTANEGRFHTKWLNMIYPRLYLARNLLRDDGVIFISIDDNEVTNLRKLCDEVFGEENFVAQFVWNTEGHTDNQLDVKINHEYICLYVKNSNSANLEHIIDPNTRPDSNLWKGFAENSITKNGPGNPPSVVELPIGFPCLVEKVHLDKGELPDDFFTMIEQQKYISRQITAQWNVSYPIRKTEMVVNNSKLVKPCTVFSGWANADKLNDFIRNNCQPIDDNGDLLTFYLSEKGVIYYRRERDKARNIMSVLRNMGTTERMRSELESDGIFFQYPKPKELLSYIIKVGANSNDIILDFFAGSATTAHAVLDLNKQDGGQRKFILVQLPEPCGEDTEAFKAGYRNIADIGKERIRRVINKLNAEQQGKLDLEGDADQDRGFRVLKLDQSNFKPWRPLAASASVAEIEQQLFAHIDHLEADATPEDLLFEILLKAGFAPTAQAEQRMLAGIPVFSVAEGALLICLAQNVSKELIDAVVAENPQQFICLDAAFGGNDQLKSNAVQTFKAHNLQKEKHNQIVFKTV